MLVDILLVSAMECLVCCGLPHIFPSFPGIVCTGVGLPVDKIIVSAISADA